MPPILRLVAGTLIDTSNPSFQQQLPVKFQSSPCGELPCTSILQSLLLDEGVPDMRKATPDCTCLNTKQSGPCPLGFRFLVVPLLVILNVDVF